LHSIKTFLAKYSAFLWALLQPLGAWGVFAIAAVDAALLGLPLDPVVGGYVYKHPQLFWLYTLMAAAGSALGCIVLYGIGYLGGEAVLEKRMSKQKFAKIRASFERHEFLALMLPAMLPPPTPFKLFVLSAAVFEMNFWHFLLAIFLGRVARFLILSALVLAFGPQAVGLASTLMREHPMLTLAGIAAAVLVGALIWWLRRRRAPLETAEEN
jgi:membrane protein YqaA with SNARE-associated domain